MRTLSGVAVSVLVLASCSDRDPAGPAIQITGVYSLLTVNAQPLPFPLFVFGNQLYVVEQIGGTMTINANRTFVEEDVVRERSVNENGMTVIRDTVIVFTGTWVNQDSVVTLNANDATVMFGFVSRSNRLTLSFESGDSLFTYVYRRN